MPTSGKDSRFHLIDPVSRTGVSGYAREPICRDRAVAKLRALLLEGLESGPPIPVTAAWSEELRRRARARPPGSG